MPPRNTIVEIQRHRHPHRLAQQITSTPPTSAETPNTTSRMVLEMAEEGLDHACSGGGGPPAG